MTVMKVQTDHDNIRYLLKFVSKIKIFSGPLWTDLIEWKRASWELSLKTILVMRILKYFPQFYPWEYLRNSYPQNF